MRQDLFGARPNRPKIWRMHVMDAGSANSPRGTIWASLQCRRCFHKEDGHYETTITALKRGLPCPKCNQ